MQPFRQTTNMDLQKKIHVVAPLASFPVQRAPPPGANPGSRPGLLHPVRDRNGVFLWNCGGSLCWHTAFFQPVPRHVVCACAFHHQSHLQHPPPPMITHPPLSQGAIRQASLDSVATATSVTSPQKGGPRSPGATELTGSERCFDPCKEYVYSGPAGCRRPGRCRRASDCIGLGGLTMSARDGGPFDYLSIYVGADI